VSTVDRQGRITLPRTVRDALDLEAGSVVSFEITRDGVRLRRRISRADLEKWVGCLSTSDDLPDVDTIMDDLREA